MASPSATYAPSTLPYRATRPLYGSNPIAFQNTNDSRKVTANQRQWLAGKGDALQSNDAALAEDYRDQAYGAESYLHPIEDQMARGEGGYNDAEKADIGYSPQEAQQLITSAGISAGAGTASAVGGANRAAAAAGGNPTAMATYRARAARQMAGDAGDAMTRARVAGKQQVAAGARDIGQTRLGKQTEGLNWYEGLQSQKNQNAQNYSGLEHSAYGTQAGATNSATDDVLKASQTPTGFDKAMGVVSGIAKFVADGTSGNGDYFGDDSDAVVGEDGPEMIMNAAGNGYADMNSGYMADGMAGSGEAPEFEGSPGGMNATVQQGDDVRAGWMKRAPGAIRAAVSQGKPDGQQKPEQPWTPVKTHENIGDTIGRVAGRFLADGQSFPNWMETARSQPGQLITSPTRVKLAPGDAVVPLTFRPKAKIRPSAALPAMAR